MDYRVESPHIVHIIIRYSLFLIKQTADVFRNLPVAVPVGGSGIPGIAGIPGIIVVGIVIIMSRFIRLTLLLRLVILIDLRLLEITVLGGFIPGRCIPEVRCGVLVFQIRGNVGNPYIVPVAGVRIVYIPSGILLRT